MRSLHSAVLGLSHVVERQFASMPVATNEFPELSLVMPCLNEAETIEFCVREALQSGAGEVVVADNGSTDGSQQLAATLGARVISVSEKGYGNALRGGIDASRGRYIVMGDADASYDFAHATRIVEKLEQGFDLVMGNRFLGGIETGAMPWLHRYLGNPVLSGIGRLFFRCPVGDFHCGLRGFTRGAYDRMNLQTTGMEFASEMVIKATLLGMKIAEVPTTLRPDGRSRPPHLRSWRDGWRHLRFMLLFCPRWLFVIPGTLLLTVGLVVTLFIAFHERFSLAGVSLNVNSSFVAAMSAIVGYQILLTGVFASSFGRVIGTHPASGFPKRPRRQLSLEHGVFGGFLLMAVGGLGIFYALWHWRNAGFGHLNPSVTVAWVVPSVMAFMVGVQTVFGSFLLSLLSLIPNRNPRSECYPN